MVLKISTLFILSIALVSCSNQPKVVEESNAIEQPLTIKDGKNLYSLRCVSCHGEDGKLGISGAFDLSKSTLSDVEMTSTIKKGRNGMPSFDGALTDEQQNVLVTFVKSLRK